MKNNQTYYYNLFLRILIMGYVLYYNASLFKHFDLLYNKSFSTFLATSQNIFGVIPNILNYISGAHSWYLWYFIFLLAPLLITKKTSKISAIILAYIYICLGKTDPMSVTIGTQIFIMILVLIALIPIPQKATDIIEEETETFTHPYIFLALWINFALIYSYSGLTKIINYSWYSGEVLNYIHLHPAFRTGVASYIFEKIPKIIKVFLTYYVAIGELLVFLGLFNTKLRKHFWWICLTIQIGLLFFMNLLDIQLIMLIYSFLVFDPAWIRGRYTATDIQKAQIWYDGECALCHNFIKFIINEDTFNFFTFSPLQQKQNTDAANLKLNTILVYTHNNLVLSKSDAIIYCLQSLGGVWLPLSFCLKIIPKKLRDLVYDFIGSARIRVWGKKENLCPTIPEYLKYKFI